MALRPGELYLCLNDTTPERYMSITGPDRILRFGPDEGIFTDTVVFNIQFTDNGLVHIKSVYSNLYWVRESESKEVLSVAAVNPVEDTTKVGCTLFRPNVASNNRVSFQHVRSQLNVAVQKTEPYFLTVANAAPTVFSFFEYVDNRLKIPKYIAFSGDIFMFLKPGIVNDRPYLQFLGLGTPADDSALVFETFATRTGEYRFKSLTFGKLWRAESSKWVMVDYADESYNDPNNLDTIFKVSSHVYGSREGIGLLCLGSDKLCHRQEEGVLRSCLSIETLKDADTVLNPIDPCNSTITISSFRQETLEDLGSYVVENPQEIKNDTKEDKEVVVNKVYDHAHSLTFSNRIKMKWWGWGSKTFICSLPFVNEKGQFEVPTGLTTINKMTWNSSGKYSISKEAHVKVVVPAMTKLKVRLMGRKMSCWAPFSYTERSQFGTQELNDGTFYGVYTYTLVPEVTESQPL